MNDRKRIEAALQRFNQLHDKDIDLGLHRMLRLMSRLDHPEAKLPHPVHVAGTNGKGSTCAFLRAFAEANGRAVHLHTSPHLIRLNERYVVASREITDTQLADLLEAAEAANDGAPATQFELLTAAAFLAFAQTPADLSIMEVGLGGELDATNVLANPEVCIITPIAHDHADWLGTDMANIAKAKAGIIKPGAKVISAAQNDIAEDVIRRTAARKGVEVIFAGQDFQVHEEGGRLCWQDDSRFLDLPLPALPGAHQIQNAGMAIAAALQLELSPQAISRGLETVRWPGRLQSVAPFPPLHEETEIWVDGAHNPHAAHELAAFLNTRQAAKPLPLHVLFSQQPTKDIAGFFGELSGLEFSLHIVPMPHAPFPPDMDALAEVCAQSGHKPNAHTDIEAALAALPEDPVRLSVAGSLFLAGDFLKTAQTKTPA